VDKLDEMAAGLEMSHTDVIYGFKKEEEELHKKDWGDEHPCPVCAQHCFHKMGEMEKCPVCGWTDDRSAEEDPEAPGDNGMSLNEARRRWVKKGGRPGR